MEFFKNNKKMVALVAAIVMGVATFFDFIKAKASYFGYSISESETLFKATWQGKFVLCFAAVAVIIILAKKIKLVYAPAVLSVILTVWAYLGEKDEVDVQGVSTNPELGFFLVLIGALVLCFITYLEFQEAKKEGKTVKEFFDPKEFKFLVEKETYTELFKSGK